MNKDFGVEFNR